MSFAELCQYLDVTSWSFKLNGQTTRVYCSSLSASGFVSFDYFLELWIFRSSSSVTAHTSVFVTYYVTRVLSSCMHFTIHKYTSHVYMVGQRYGPLLCFNVLECVTVFILFPIMGDFQRVIRTLRTRGHYEVLLLMGTCCS